MTSPKTVLLYPALSVSFSDFDIRRVFCHGPEDLLGLVTFFDDEANSFIPSHSQLCARQSAVRSLASLYRVFAETTQQLPHFL